VVDWGRRRSVGGGKSGKIGSREGTYSRSIGRLAFQSSSPARARKTDLPPPCQEILTGTRSGAMVSSMIVMSALSLDGTVLLKPNGRDEFTVSGMNFGVEEGGVGATCDWL
jgi:hypothetical protein